MEIATICYSDDNEREEACVIVRTVDGSVGLCISLRSNGDIETFLNKDAATKLIDALNRAVAEV